MVTVVMKLMKQQITFKSAIRMFVLRYRLGLAKKSSYKKKTEINEG